ncbi:MAG: DegT/DnrJ/EryC1/StrS family aminotransferase [Candidatus Puniceispirillales bacterium]
MARRYDSILMKAMLMKSFEKPFTQQESIPEDGIARAVEIMRTGRLHRYNLAEGEVSEVSLLEKEYADWQGSQYCVACTSGGYAIALALRLVGVKPGDQVLANAYTLAPVPGAIHNTGAEPVFIEIDDNYHMDCADFEAKAISSGAKVLLLSHMRGHIADMNMILDICRRHDITLVEDCAHTMGAKWQGMRSGNFGKVAAFSTQTYKHMNSGEGGFLTTDDPELAARAVISSGSYMLYDRHGAIPEQNHFDAVKYLSPNYSGRMDHLRAALLRAQMPLIEQNINRWNSLYDDLHRRIKTISGLSIPDRKQDEAYVGSSIQFRLDAVDKMDIPDVIKRLAGRGVELKWFGDDEPKAFTSRYDSWQYVKEMPHLPKTLSVLEKTVDMRIPLTFNLDDTALIGDILEDEITTYMDKKES